jgi:hypothetical protein
MWLPVRWWARMIQLIPFHSTKIHFLLATMVVERLFPTDISFVVVHNVALMMIKVNT